MEENQIRNAFNKVKEDLNDLRFEISELRELIKTLYDKLNTLKLHNLAENSVSTHRQINTTHPVTSTHNTTVPYEIRGLKPLNLGISIGNEGVSTDRQTDRQTDISTQNAVKYPQNTIESNIFEAHEILDSLDQIKRQIRSQFKKVTAQEMLVFSTIYQLEEQNSEQVTYKCISLKLGLSQSSIRDYVQRMVNKGIPIKKQKINNKSIILSISEDLRKIASLSTIIQLREL